jgi:hypothetical protein
VDPVSGVERSVPMSTSFTTPGENAGGDADWLLLLSAQMTGSRAGDASSASGQD